MRGRKRWVRQDSRLANRGHSKVEGWCLGWKGRQLASRGALEEWVAIGEDLK